MPEEKKKKKEELNKVTIHQINMILKEMFVHKMPNPIQDATSKMVKFCAMKDSQ